jgi:hypothetical protein
MRLALSSFCSLRDESRPRADAYLDRMPTAGSVPSAAILSAMLNVALYGLIRFYADQPLPGLVPRGCWCCLASCQWASRSPSC